MSLHELVTWYDTAKRMVGGEESDELGCLSAVLSM
jgi:hypothetical protein